MTNNSKAIRREHTRRLSFLYQGRQFINLEAAAARFFLVRKIAKRTAMSGWRARHEFGRLYHRLFRICVDVFHVYVLQDQVVSGRLQCRIATLALSSAEAVRLQAIELVTGSV
jgi:hypothetical protein